MSRKIVRYEGEGRRRRPVFEDQGPANGRGSSDSGTAMIARLSDVSTASLAPAAGAAAVIERRMATEAQRTHWRTPATADSPIAPVRVERPAMGSPEHLQASRMRGAARHVEVITARRPAPAPPPEEPVMDDVAAPTTDQPPASAVTTHPAKLALRELHDASNEAEQAWDELQAAEVAVFHAEERWELGHRRLVRAQDDLAAALAPITPPDDGHVHYAGSGATIDEAIAAMGLPSAEPPDDASEVVTRRADDPTATPAAAFAAFARELAAKAAGGGPGSHRHQGKGSKTPLVTGLTRRQAEVIEAVTRHNGSVSAAAKELRATYPTVTAVIKGVGRKGLLPADLIPMLPAAFARYSGV